MKIPPISEENSEISVVSICTYASGCVCICRGVCRDVFLTCAHGKYIYVRTQDRHHSHKNIIILRIRHIYYRYTQVPEPFHRKEAQAKPHCFV